MKSLLVTGGAGFIGSNFIPYYLDKHPDTYIVNLDALTYAGSIDNLTEVLNHPRHRFVEGNICDRMLVERLFEEYRFQGIIHFAAESHVDNSIDNPSLFVETNVNGTFTLLDVAYHHWMEKPFIYNTKHGTQPRFHHISTDEVYGSLGKTGLFTEKTPYAPNSPYSASKASSDMLVRSYHHTYGLNTIITNCSNNYGPKQHDEKLIPTILRKALSGEPIPIYGSGRNIRDWLYVEDHCRGIDAVFQNAHSGETYNIGGNNEYTNLQIAQHICQILDELSPPLELPIKSYSELITFVSDRPGHDLRYAINATKISETLGWQTKENFESGIIKTIKWYLEKYND